MNLADLEKMFNRAFAHSFSKRKWLLVFPILAICGLLAVICQTISIHATPWIQMSLAFLPIFLCAGLLLGVGIVLTRVYHHEVKGRKIEYIKTIRRSASLFWGIAYLAVPLIFAYLILWMFLGIFYLLQAIPKVGEYIGTILSFGPFLLVLGSIVLGVLTVLMLFYITPEAALKSHLRPQIVEEVLRPLKENPFRSLFMPLWGLLPLFIALGILTFAASVTKVLYVEVGHSLFYLLKWLFMMLPFCALLTPVVTFFFNFAAETFVLSRKTEKNT